MFLFTTKMEKHTPTVQAKKQIRRTRNTKNGEKKQKDGFPVIDLSVDEKKAKRKNCISIYSTFGNGSIGHVAPGSVVNFFGSDDPVVIPSQPIKKKKTNKKFHLVAEKVQPDCPPIKNPCVSCFEKEVTTIGMPCGHAVMCNACARKFANDSIAKDKPVLCPTCRSELTGIHGAYL